MSRDGACDGSLTEGVCCWGSCQVEGHFLSVCLFDYVWGKRKIIYQLPRLVAAGLGGGVGRLGKGRLSEGCRNDSEMHDLVRELALQVYKNICKNISKFRNLLHSTQEVGRHFISYCVPANNFIHRTDAVLV